MWIYFERFTEDGVEEVQMQSSKVISRMFETRICSRDLMHDTASAALGALPLDRLYDNIP